MEPGPDTAIRAIVLSLAAGLWVTVWTAIFIAAMPGASTGFATVAILAAIAGGWIIPVQWFRLTAGFLLLGSGIGLAVSAHWAIGIAGIAAATVLFTLWWRRLAPKLALYRTGVKTPGTVVSADGKYGSEDTHVRTRCVVQFVDATGQSRTTLDSNDFPVNDQPRAGDVADVYYRADDPSIATVVFAKAQRR